MSPPGIPAKRGWPHVQSDVQLMGAWVVDRFSPDHLSDEIERVDRILEEAIELHQAVHRADNSAGLAKAIRLAQRVYNRLPDDRDKELGGLMTCILAYAASRPEMDLVQVVTDQIDRCLGLTREHVQSKHNAKVESGVGVDLPYVVDTVGTHARPMTREERDAYARHQGGQVMRTPLPVEYPENGTLQRPEDFDE